MLDAHIKSLSAMMTVVSRELNFNRCLTFVSDDEYCKLASFGSSDERSRSIADTINEINRYVSSNDPRNTRELRLFVVKHLPEFLLGYMSLRFPHIVDSSAKVLPGKADLAKFPDIIESSGFYVPVSTCLRLLAVSLSDNESKQELVSSPIGVKTVVSHMVDDPLNPYQRESAVFVIKVLTHNFPQAQEALSKVVSLAGIS